MIGYFKNAFGFLFFYIQEPLLQVAVLRVRQALLYWRLHFLRHRQTDSPSCWIRSISAVSVSNSHSTTNHSHRQPSFKFQLVFRRVVVSTLDSHTEGLGFNPGS